MLARRRSDLNPARKYFALLKWSRLATFAFIVLFLVYLVWAIPWLKVGLDFQDYTEEFSFTMFLITALALTGMTSLLLRRSVEREREALIAWTSVYDEVTGLRNRRYFLDRLQLECQRAAEGGPPFGVFLFSIETDRTDEVGHGRAPSPEILRDAGRVIAHHIRGSDVVAVIGPTELAVLEVGGGPDVTELVIEAVAACVFDEAGHAEEADLRLRAGRGTFGPGVSEPGEVLRSARERLFPVQRPEPCEARPARASRFSLR